MNAQHRQRVVVGLSGGVDSAVAALLLRRQGYDVTGLFMKNWEEDDREDYCAAEEDLKEARRVCARLQISLHTVNFSAEYWERVFSYFLAEYEAGRTPNPDVLCNKEIKFKAFLEHALRLGADKIATGHYARIGRGPEGHRLHRARDSNKDQTYFLYTLGQHELAHSLFPLGGLTKPEVRALARAAGLPNHARKDSTGICFIGERHFKTFLGRYLPARRGEVRTLSGEVKGMHDGLMYYTIGQRHGLGIGGAGEPWYVVDKDLEHNVLYVVQGEQHPTLFSRGLAAADLHWVAGKAPDPPLPCEAKTRYRQPQQPCTITCRDHDGVEVIFEQAQRAITPGQSVVFYRDDTCLGGGIIRAARGAAPGDHVPGADRAAAQAVNSDQ